MIPEDCERGVDDRRRLALERSGLDERELRQHHQIPGARECIGQPARLGIVVAELGRAIHEHHTRVPRAPAGDPPRHTHIGIADAQGRLLDPRLRCDGRGKVPVPERARVDIRDDHRTRADRSKKRTPQGCDEQHDDEECDLPRHCAATMLGGRRERAVADPVLGLLPERYDLARVEDRRVRTRDDSDKQREREVAHRKATEEEQGEQGEHDGQ